MEVSRKNYNSLLAKYRELETTLATLSGRKEEATGRLKTLEGELNKLTKGMDAKEVLMKLEKEAEVRVDVLRAKVVELERLVADFKFTGTSNTGTAPGNKEFDFDVEV
jgi:chromosome segregation ATPase